MPTIVRRAHRVLGLPNVAALLLLALAAALVPTPPAAVERLYSTTAYLVLQPWLTAAANRVPFALLDALIVAAAGGWIAALVLDLRRSVSGRILVRTLAGRVAARTLVLVAASYLAFLFAWGLNYRRVPLAEKLRFDAGRVSSGAARDLAAVAVERVNALPALAHLADAAPAAGLDARLADAFARAQRDLGAHRLAVAGRPKHSLLDLYFRRAAVDGMTDPYFLETLVVGDLLPFERPFVVAHEWGHLAGYADEGEANLVGWLICVRGADSDQYSGWLFLYGQLVPALVAADRAELAGRLAPGPRADRRATADRIRQHISPRVSAAGWSVYDRYLKANRVEAGAASYAHVVRLALGATFGPDWTPLLK